MKKSLLSVLLGTGVLIAAMLLVLRKGFWGPLILLALAAMYVATTVVSEAIKIYGKKVRRRDRHA